MAGTPCSRGDVLFGKLRPYLAKVFLIEEDSVCASEFIAMRPTSLVDSRFLRYALTSAWFVELIDAMSYGTKMPRVDPGSFLDVGLPMLDRGTQSAIADYLDTETSRIDRLIDRKQHFIDLLLEKRAALIAHAVTKGLDPTVEMKANASFFAFTATPKRKTLELFGVQLPDGQYEAFSLYSMRQAIEEKFILDVLRNYTTCKTYWRLLKTAESDPRYDHDKASSLLRSFVDLHEHTIRQKVEIMVEHFRNNSAGRIGGRAKAMIVTRSRLHAVRYKLILDAYLKEQGYPYKALVAFSGTVQDADIDYTENSMNGLPERQTAATFHAPDRRFLVVAEKFQTGFDEPLLHTMYVDKKLSDVHAIQTLSRLNRIHPEKTDTMVLDFVNDADDIAEAFQLYYENTMLSEGTDPNLLYDLETRLKGYGFFGSDDIDAFAAAFFSDKSQAKLYAILKPPVDRWLELTRSERKDSRKSLGDYVSTYTFLGQLLTFADPDLEKLFVFAKYLRRYFPRETDTLPLDVQDKADIESYRVSESFRGDIQLDRGKGELEPANKQGAGQTTQERLEPLSAIIAELNERFGADLSDEDRLAIGHLEDLLGADETLKASMKVNPPETARLAFDHIVQDRLQDIVETNFRLYKRVTDDHAFGQVLIDWLYDRFRKGAVPGMESRPKG